MVSSGFVRDLEQDGTSRSNFEIDDCDRRIPRLYLTNLDRKQLGINIQLLERLTHNGASLQIPDFDSSCLERKCCRRPSHDQHEAEEDPQHCLAHDLPPYNIIERRDVIRL